MIIAKAGPQVKPKNKATTPSKPATGNHLSHLCLRPVCRSPLVFALPAPRRRLEFNTRVERLQQDVGHRFRYRSDP